MKAAIVIAALSTVGCSSKLIVKDGCVGHDGQACISLEVLGPASTRMAVDQLELGGAQGFQFRPLNDVFSPSAPGPEVALPVVVPVLPGAGTGMFTLAVRGLRGGAVVGTGTTSGVLSGTDHLALSISLAPGAGADADASQSTITIDRPTGVAANGSDAAKITVRCVDDSGTPLVGRSVALSASPDGAVLTPSGLTDVDGTMTATMTSTTKTTYTLTAIVEPTGAATQLSSMPAVIFVTPGKLAFTTQPKTIAVGATMTIAVSIVDPATGAVIVDATTPVTLAVGSNPTNAALLGDIVATPSSGVATFTNINLDNPGSGFTLTATAPSLLQAVSTSFDITSRPWQRVSVGLDSGNATRLAYDPTDGNIVYATTYLGVYKSVDGGSNWHFASYNATGATWALAIDPKTPTTLYASSLGAAVYKSTNSGASWKQLQLPPGALSYGVVVDPLQPSTILDDTQASILRSDDAGNTWSVALANASQLTVGAGPIYAQIQVGPAAIARSIDHGKTWTMVSPNGGGGILTADPVHPDTIYGTAGLPQKSTDSGMTWIAASGNLPPNASVHRIGISPADPLRIYGALDSGGAAVSNDGAQTWGAIALPHISGFAAAAHPTNPAKGIVSSLNGGTFATSDGGATWSHAERGIPASVQHLALSNGALFAATGGGLFQSLNAGTSWTRVPGLEDGIGVRATASDGSGTLYAVMSADIPPVPVIERFNSGTLQWVPLNAAATNAPNGFVRAFVIDPGSATHFLAGNSGGVVFATTNSGASSWTMAQVCNGQITSLTFVGSTHTPFATCKTSSATDPSGVFTSADGGVTWSSTSNGANGIPTSVGVTALAANAAGTLFYAGTVSGGIYKSTDHVTWTSMSTGVPMTSDVSSLVIDGANNSRVWASAQKVYVTTNGGTTWTEADDGITAAAMTLLWDPTSTATVYCGTLGGVFKSTTGGQ